VFKTPYHREHHVGHLMQGDEDGARRSHIVQLPRKKTYVTGDPDKLVVAVLAKSDLIIKVEPETMFEPPA
jgi:hypothetical protein